MFFVERQSCKRSLQSLNIQKYQRKSLRKPPKKILHKFRFFPEVDKFRLINSDFPMKIHNFKVAILSVNPKNAPIFRKFSDIFIKNILPRKNEIKEAKI